MKLKIAKPAATVPATTKKAAPRSIVETHGPKPKTAKTPAKPSAAEPAERSGKHIGVTSGMRIMAYQDMTMAAQPTKKLTDEELAKDWEREFPEARCKFTERPEVVRTVRRLFNAGSHGKQTLVAPDGGISKYELQGTKRVPVAEAKRGSAAA